MLTRLKEDASKPIIFNLEDGLNKFQNAKKSLDPTLQDLPDFLMNRKQVIVTFLKWAICALSCNTKTFC